MSRSTGSGLPLVGELIVRFPNVHRIRLAVSEGLEVVHWIDARPRVAGEEA